MAMASSRRGGFTLVEQLFAMVVTSIIAMAVLGSFTINYKASEKVFNSSETTSAAHNVIARIGKDIREGRSLGDIYGITPTSDQFPVLVADGGTDPNYSSGQTPPAGWPAGWTTPYQLSNQCLIVQIPILDNHNDTTNGKHAQLSANTGWPTCVSPGQGSPPATTTEDNVETHVYMIVADPNNPGEFLMQYACFPGMASTAGGGNYVPAAHSFGPQTICSGIIGPLDSGSGLPKVFQFLDKTDATGQPHNQIEDQSGVHDGALVANFTGVVVNLELREHRFVNKKTRNISLKPIGFKTEVFLRNNAMATSSGIPAN